MGTGKNVMVFIETRHGKIADVSLELVSAANGLAASLGGSVEAVAIGCALHNELETLGRYGCRRVYYTDDERLAHFTSIPYAKTVVRVIRDHQPGVVLFGATTMGRDVAPRVASTLQCGLTADCTDLQIGEHDIKDVHYENTLMQIRPAFGGNIIATIVSPESTPSMATVREGVMKMVEPDPAGTVEIIQESCQVADDDFLTEILEVVSEEKQVNLKAAQIIVPPAWAPATPRPWNWSGIWPGSWAANWAVPGRWWIPGSWSRITRWGRQGPRSAPTCTLPAGFQARYSTGPACRKPSGSLPSTEIPRHPFSPSPTTGLSGMSRMC
jgi:electron transfer flavoprotein alpha subunit